MDGLFLINEDLESGKAVNPLAEKLEVKFAPKALLNKIKDIKDIKGMVKGFNTSSSDKTKDENSSFYLDEVSLEEFNGFETVNLDEGLFKPKPEIIELGGKIYDTLISEGTPICGKMCKVASKKFEMDYRLYSDMKEGYSINGYYPNKIKAIKKGKKNDTTFDALIASMIVLKENEEDLQPMVKFFKAEVEKYNKAHNGKSKIFLIKSPKYYNLYFLVYQKTFEMSMFKESYDVKLDTSLEEKIFDEEFDTLFDEMVGIESSRILDEELDNEFDEFFK